MVETKHMPVFPAGVAFMFTFLNLHLLNDVITYDKF